MATNNIKEDSDLALTTAALPIDSFSLGSGFSFSLAKVDNTYRVK